MLSDALPKKLARYLLYTKCQRIKRYTLNNTFRSTSQCKSSTSTSQQTSSKAHSQP